jgi:hypothetical protein
MLSTINGDAMWSKNSYGLAVVVLQQPAEPFSTSNWAFMLIVLANNRKEQHVALSLIVALIGSSPRIKKILHSPGASRHP